jgi:hypothetical protein
VIKAIKGDKEPETCTTQQAQILFLSAFIPLITVTPFLPNKTQRADASASARSFLFPVNYIAGG